MTNGNTPCISGGYTNMMTNERTETRACDCISRQAAIDGVKTLHDVAWKNWHEPTLSANVVLDMIRELPPAQPERKKGKWIPQDHNKTNGIASTLVYYYPKCSVCGHCDNYTNFCSNCGADMRGKQDG